jgi:hypothetical protein
MSSGMDSVLSPLPFGADGGAPKLAGRRRHHGLGVGRGEEMMAGEDAMMAPAAPAPAAAVAGRRRRHSRRAGQSDVSAGRRRKHSRRAGQDAAVAGRRRKHSRRGRGESVVAGRRRHTRKH